MEAIVGLVVLVAVFAFIRWLFPGRPGFEVRGRVALVARGDEVTLATVYESVPEGEQGDRLPVATAWTVDPPTAGRSEGG